MYSLEEAWSFYEVSKLINLNGSMIKEIRNGRERYVFIYPLFCIGFQISIDISCCLHTSVQFLFSALQTRARYIALRERTKCCINGSHIIESTDSTVTIFLYINMYDLL